MPNLHAYVSAANTASAAEDSTAAKSADNSSQSSAGEPAEAPTHMKPKRKRSKRPEVHVHKPTRSYSLVQQQQLIHEFVYAEIEYEKGGKTTLLDPTNLKNGILFFWDEVAKNAALSPAFKVAKQECKVSTARQFCEEAVKNKRARMEAGEPHEPPFMKTGEGDTDEDDADSAAERVDIDSDSDNPRPAKKSKGKPLPAKQSPKESDLMISWQIECALFDFVSKVMEREREELASASEPPSEKNKKRVLNPPADSTELVVASLHGKSQNDKGKDAKDFKENSKKIRQGQMDKHFEAQDAQVEMNRALLTALKQPTIQEKSELAIAKSKAKCEVFTTVVLEGIKLWKAAPKPEQPRQHYSFLTTMNVDSLIAAIKAIGPAFAKADTLVKVLVEYGLDGTMISNMKDEAIRQLLTGDGGLSGTLADILMAKLTSWRLS